MKITKEGQEYINDFSVKAAKIFRDLGLTYGGLFEENYFPLAEEIAKSITEKVGGLKGYCVAQESGRVLVHKSDFEPGFALYINIKPLPQTLNRQPIKEPTR